MEDCHKAVFRYKVHEIAVDAGIRDSEGKERSVCVWWSVSVCVL